MKLYMQCLSTIKWHWEKDDIQIILLKFASNITAESEISEISFS